MRLADSHAHLYGESFKDDLSEIIDRAREQGVEKIFMPNVDHDSIDTMMETAHRYPDICIPMMGLHPCSVKKGFERDLYEVESWLDKGLFCAVGEMGTDLYWDKTFFAEQQEAFKIQCELALKHQLPIVIHCRESIDETISLVKPFADRGLKGVFHCFSGTLDQAREMTGMGFYIGIGGVATFKNGGIGETLTHVAIEHMVLETDSPYLAPVPHRGKRNEPGYLKLVADKITALSGRDVEEIGEITTQNTLTLFSKG